MSKVATFYQYYYKDIFNYVYNLLNDIDAAQEIVQETFTCLCENIDMDASIDQKKVKVWALEKAHYLSIKYLQKVDDVLLNSIKVTSNIWSREILEEKIQIKALREFLRSMLQEIKIEHQKAICLVDLQGLSYKESAYLLDITEEAFGSLLKRARQAFIRKILKEFNPDLLKLPLSLYEQRMLLTWFDILDYPNNIEKEISTKVQGFFNGFHQSFEDFRRETYPRNLNQYLLSLVQLNKSSIVADFGAGTGSLIKDVSPLVSEVFAIDHSIEMLKTVTNLQKNYGLSNVKTISADVSMDLSFMKGSVDVGFSCMLIHHIFNPLKAIKQMTKTLVAGGELVIADLTFTNKNWRFKESHDFWTGFKAEQLQKWLEEAELEIIKLSENDNYHFCFNDLKVKGKYVKVPLLIAHCRKK
ncbi:hypothetical protein CHH80_11560 [Bacillus sp. 7504-2]|nr:hypothetical protein CHH80_11560 [Bacillus sp. 7504-2]